VQRFVVGDGEDSVVNKLERIEEQQQFVHETIVVAVAVAVGVGKEKSPKKSNPIEDGAIETPHLDHLVPCSRQFELEIHRNLD